MNIDFTEEELAFQQEVRQFLSENFPADLVERNRKGYVAEKDDWVRWQKILHEKGWVAINWPVEYGGTGWTPTQKYIWEAERARIGAPDVMAFGIKMVGPVIYTFGTDEQKQRFLPDILASNVWWCQGYSEPNAGSDLASLRTTAVRDGDEYVVNGTKTWTTLGHYADWIFCLVRTGGPDVKNQEAISFLLIDMNTPGITVSPIITLDGHREVNEVHFDNVRVPVANRIHDEGKGWTCAKYLLTHERSSIAQVALSRERLKRLKLFAADKGAGGSSLLDDSAFAQKVAGIEIDLLALEYTELRILAQMQAGQAPGPESSILKIKGTEIIQGINELFMEASGYYAMPYINAQFERGFDGEHIGPGIAASTALTHFNGRKESIYGGSNEVQRNIICKAVLGL